MKRNDPSALFDFDSVVIVGASDDPTRIGGVPIFLLKKYGFQGAIYGLNPKRDSVQGLPCFAQPSQLPGKIDVAIFCVAADKVRELLPDLQRKGLKAAVIFSSGFSETGESGRELQRWLTDYARAKGIAVLGPNCLGQISFVKARPLTFSNPFVTLPVMPTGPVALLSQSGAIATNIWADAVFSGARFSHVIMTGNEADLGVADYLEYLADDDCTQAVIGYVEALNDGPRFCAAAARMRERGKPLVLIKVGKSAAGQDAVSSHTGQLCSDDSGYQAAFDRYGIVRANSLEELNDYARIFAIGALEPKVTIVTTSGGAGVYATDLCTELGIETSVLSPHTEAALGEIVPAYGRTRNPVDLTAHVVNDVSILKTSLRLLLDDPETGVLLFLLSGKGLPEQAREVISVLGEIQQGTSKRIVLCWLGVPEDVRRRGRDAGLVIYQDPARFLRPLKGYLAAKRKDAPARIGMSTGALDEKAPPVFDRAWLRARLESVQGAAPVLGERHCMELLEQNGIDCPRHWHARSAEDVRRIGEQAPWPCVMKIVAPVIAHKSDVGGVVTKIESARELLAAWERMVQRLGAREVLVAEQIEKGVEVLVGCVRDETFGMRLTLGAGGVWTNHLREAVTLIPPFDEGYLRDALARLSIWAPITGARGQPKLAADELVQTVSKIAALGQVLLEEIREFECNPVIVTPTRAVAVDAIGFASSGPLDGGA